MNRSLSWLLAATATLTLTSAYANEAAGGGKPTMDAAARAQHLKTQFDKRFADADTNGDGKLSREEAQAKMPRVAQRFDQIDTGKTGLATKAQVWAKVTELTAERRAKK
jgi:hypothetical protein